MRELCDNRQGTSRSFYDGRVDRLLQSGRLADVKKVVDLVFGPSLRSVDRMVYDYDLKPKHGPGATSERLSGNQKWTFPFWHDRLEYLFPFVEYGVPSYSHWEESNQVQFLSPLEELPSRLVAVPKTAKGPRLIAIEPVCNQYMQQGIAGPLVECLEKGTLEKRQNLSHWFLGFSEQWPNQAMAQIGSEDGSLATIDMSDASDRIPNWLVEELMSDYPHLNEGIQACRSTRVQLLDGEVIPLSKFASMGSALTFPIEAMVFCAIAIESVLRASRVPISRGYIAKLRDQVRVYGDDIIVPTHTAEFVSSSLEDYGFRVNKHKSFWTGEFRESCGKEYWRGHDVSIVKVRKSLPSTRHDVAELVSAVSLRNHLFKDGWESLTEALDVLLTRLLVWFPAVLETSPVLGRWQSTVHYQVDGSDQHLHAPFVKGFVKKPKIPENSISGIPALMKCLAESIDMPDVDRDHLTRSGRPRAVSIKLVKGRPF